MGKVDITADKKQAGFTLVELAVVMIIIGLLIGGVLKGQELIANAQIASTVAGIKGIDAATSTFNDTYNAFPGDMSNALTRLPNCAAPCANGNG
ncbi:MAG TPA: prepilin-type N-terminal cleavage/methylation domain-containing protein, partial [Micavibrio sp.]|nr:prepilin-type N-terminal cleavage/methylation domain-containing protein [Micavibrio sp.]